MAKNWNQDSTPHALCTLWISIFSPFNSTFSFFIQIHINIYIYIFFLSPSSSLSSFQHWLPFVLVYIKRYWRIGKESKMEKSAHGEVKRRHLVFKTTRATDALATWSSRTKCYQDQCEDIADLHAISVQSTKASTFCCQGRSYRVKR